MAVGVIETGEVDVCTRSGGEEGKRWLESGCKTKNHERCQSTVVE